MGEPQAVTGFDSAERERIRAALRRYMREHGIGAPKLQYQIEKADQPRKREIPLSTLQRFILGKHHTQEHHVALCHAFVKDLPYYGEGREAEQLGDALFGFLQEPVDDKAREALTARLAKEFAGAFETRTRPATAGGAFPYPPESNVAESRILFAPAPGKPWLNVREFVTDMRNYAERPERRFAYDGVLLFAAPLIYVLLRNTLTRQPKTYSLGRVPTPAADGEVLLFEGEGFDTAFMRDDPGQRMSRNFRVQFVPAASEEPQP